MPKPAFFSSLGLFIETDFLDVADRMRIQKEITFAQVEKAAVFGRNPERGTVDENVRKTLSANVEESTATFVWERLRQLKPKIENHFHLSLSGLEMPHFLNYQQGAFYKAHRDSNPQSLPSVSHRRISVVIFLNGSSSEPLPSCYGGGALKLYGLVSGPEWEKCGLPVEAEPGLLVGFPSEMLHEVEPVTFGQRFTIVSWFTN